MRPFSWLALVLGAACTSRPSPAPPADAAVAVDAGATVGSVAGGSSDPFLWLEDVTSERSLAWVKDRNAASTRALTAAPEFEPLRARLFKAVASKDDLPSISRLGKFFYNLWTDDEHPRGLWRRVPSLAEYKKASPAWETVLDLDDLGKKEHENWVWSGADCLYPRRERCLVSLSRGGADATVVREFDTVTKQFVPGGFTLPEAKSSIAWKDLDTVYVETDFGPGSLSPSGYPLVAKEWKRGTPLASATLVYQGQPTDMSVTAAREFDHGKIYDLVFRQVTDDASETYLLRQGQRVKLDVPDTMGSFIWNDQLVLTLKDDWVVSGKTWARGAALIIGLEPFLAGARDFQVLFDPTPHRSMAGFSTLKTALVMNVLDDVHNELWLFTRDAKGRWRTTPMPTAPLSTTSVDVIDDDVSDDYFVFESGFTSPLTLSVGRPGGKPERLRQQPTFFDAAGLEVTQHFATSRDGTRVPYFQVSRAGLALDGTTPTLLTGYGGFEISMLPEYGRIAGIAWLERGGAYVVANIRGGGEYGPAWHRVAQLEKRQNAYDDFIAVAEDLVARKVTVPAHLAIEGGSNGGLLMGVMLTERPDLFGAVWSAAPLLDMRRYHTLLAGASWMSEYGDPDKPEAWAWLSKYSPYQNVKKGVSYPRVLFTTSTRDDRVHPGHARKMAARMLEQGHDVLFWENVEGGHSGAVTPEETAYLEALGYTFLATQVGLTKAAPPR